MPSELLTLEQALARILEHAAPLPVDVVPVHAAAGRVLREDATAVVDLPPFPSSAMDGFAVRAVDTPGELPVAFHVAAGTVGPSALPAGAAAGIATGGSVPDGADAVVPVERVEDLGDRVIVPERAEKAQHVRPIGGDVRAGQMVVEAGAILGAAQIGALAAAGVAVVRCSARPRVVVLATGSELRRPGEDLRPGEIYESNRAMLAASLRAAGADVEVSDVVADDPDAHREAIEHGLAADVLVTSGGVSMGPHDLVRKVAADLGVEEVFWRVAIKPGKPVSFGVRGSTLVFGLPGNPVSALVGALVFVRPALLARQGATSPGPLYLHGRIGSSIRRNALRDEFVRARRTLGDDGVLLLEAVGGQESHMIVRAASADALILAPRGEGEIPAGASARYLVLD